MGINFKGSGSDGAISVDDVVQLNKIGLNPSGNNFVVDAADDETHFRCLQSDSGATEHSFRFSVDRSRLFQTIPPTSFATLDGDYLTRFDGDLLYAQLPTGAGMPVLFGSASAYIGGSYWGTLHTDNLYSRSAATPSAGSINACDILPSSDSSRQLGNSNRRWYTGHIRSLTADITVNTPRISQVTNLAGIQVNGDLFPVINLTGTCGRSTNNWKLVYTTGIQSSASPNLYFGNQNGARVVYMSGGGSLRPDDDASGPPSLGSSTQRWGGCFLTNAPNVSSDEDLKQNIAQIPDALLDVWFEHVTPCQYQLKANPDGFHIGVIAQDVIAAFDAAGLDWHDYHVIYENQELIADDYTEEDAVKEDYYSVNYDAVKLIESMAIRRKLSIKPSKRFRLRP